MVQLSYTSSSNIQGFEGGSGLTRLPQLLGMSGTAPSVHDRSQGGVTEGTVCPQRWWRAGGSELCLEPDVNEQLWFVKLHGHPLQR